MHNHAALASLMESVQDALAVSARAAATLIVIIFLFIQQTLVQLIFLLRVIADVFIFNLTILDVLVGLFCLVAGIARVLVLPVFSLNSFE